MLNTVCNLNCLLKDKFKKMGKDMDYESEHNWISKLSLRLKVKSIMFTNFNAFKYHRKSFNSKMKLSKS